MSVLLIIPARVGSQRVKKKNIRLVKNKPLVYWTIIFAKKLKNYIPNLKIIISTDCKKTIKITKKLEESYLERPKKIAGSKASMHSVISQVLKKIKESNKLKFIILLQPTSPIRKISWVLKGLEILKKNKIYQNLIHLNVTNKYVGKLKKNEWIPEFSSNKRSQDIKNQYEPSGCLFLYKRKDFENLKKFNTRKSYGYVTNDMKTVNIDYEEDFVMLDYYIKKIYSKVFYN